MVMRNINDITISAILKWVRTQKGYTLKQVSEKTGISLQYIGELERGQKAPSFSTVKDLSDFYNITISETSESDYGRKLEKLCEAFLYQQVNDFKMISEAVNFDNHYTQDFLSDFLVYESNVLIVQQDFESFSYFCKLMDVYYQSANGVIYAYYCFLKTIYYSTSNPKQACYWAKESIDNAGNKNISSLLYMNYASVLLNDKKPMKALDAISVAMENAIENAIFPMIQLLKMNQAIIYGSLKQYDDAIEALDNCEEIAVKNHSKDIIWKCELNKAYMLLCSKRYEETIELTKVNLRKYPEIESFSYVQLIAKLFLNDDIKIIFSDQTPAASLCHSLIQIKKKMSDTRYIEKLLKQYEYDYCFKTILLNYLIAICHKNHDFEKEIEYLTYF